MHSEYTIELSVVMPCLNEEKTIVACIMKAMDCMKRLGVVGEIVIADNGSIDRSCMLAEELGARVIHVREKGYGSALISGIRAAKGRYVIMGDSDDSYDFSALDGFIEKLRQGYDLVMGNRFTGGIEKGAMPLLHRFLGNPVLSFLGRMFCNIDIGDFHCGLRGFNREKILSLGLACSGMEFASELVVKAANRGLNITEIPVRLAKDGRDRPPHLRSFRDGWRHLKFLLLATPRWLFFYPGLALLILCVPIFIRLLAGPLILGAVTLDVHTLVYLSAAIVIGIQMIIFENLILRMAESQNLHQSSKLTLIIRRVLSFDIAVALGVTLIVLGGGLGASAVSGWGHNKFGGMEPQQLMRSVIPSALVVMVGLQISLGGALMSGLDIIAASVKAVRHQEE